MNLTPLIMSSVMVPAYDDPTVWEGNSSIISEIAQQLPKDLGSPSAIVCSVGGGGLCGGIMQGCTEVGWDDGKNLSNLGKRTEVTARSERTLSTSHWCRNTRGELFL